MRRAVAGSLLLALAACRPLPTADPTRVALQTVGYEVVALQPHAGRGGSRLEVRVAARTAEDGETGKVAGVVWTTVPFRFDRLDVTVEGPGGPYRELFTYADLADRYGPRLPDLDRRDYGGEVARLTALLLAGVALPGVVLMAGLGIFVLSAARPRGPQPPRPPRPSGTSRRPRRS